MSITTPLARVSTRLVAAVCPLRALYRAPSKVVPLWSGCWEDFPGFAESTDKAHGSKGSFASCAALMDSAHLWLQVNPLYKSYF